MALATTSGTNVSPFVSAYARGSASLGDSNFRISSGQRIIRNGDDASSLSSATRLQAQNSTLRSTLQNGAKASSFLQIASNGLSQIRIILESLNDLVAQANDSGRTSIAFATLDAQFKSQKSRIDTVVAATTFDSISILDGSASDSGAPVIITGDASNDVITLSIPSVTSASLFSAAPGVAIGNSAEAAAATVSVADAKQLVEEAIAKVNVYQLRLDTADAATQNRIYGIDTAISGLLDADKDSETVRAERTSLQQEISATVIAQTLGLNSNLLQLVQG